MGSTVGGTGVDDTSGSLQAPHKRRWIKYYCEACEAWETREMFKVATLDRGLGAVWSWGCSKLIRHSTVQSLHVEHLSSDAAATPSNNKLVDFPSAGDSPASPAPQPEPSGPPPPPPPPHPKPSATTAEAVSALHQAGPAAGVVDAAMHRALSNGSSQQSKRPKRNVRSALRDSPLNSQAGVTSSSPDENDAALLTPKNAAAAAVGADTAGPESPAVIDAEVHETGAHKRPRRLTAGDRGLAQALQSERPRKMKAVAELKDEKPSPAAAAAVDVRRPKRVAAGLKGIVLAAENDKFAPRTPVSVKREKKDAVHQVTVQTRSSSASKKPSARNKKVGDLY